MSRAAPQPVSFVITSGFHHSLAFHYSLVRHCCEMRGGIYFNLLPLHAHLPMKVEKLCPCLAVVNKRRHSRQRSRDRKPDVASAHAHSRRIRHASRLTPASDISCGTTGCGTRAWLSNVLPPATALPPPAAAPPLLLPLLPALLLPRGRLPAVVPPAVPPPPSPPPPLWRASSDRIVCATAGMRLDQDRNAVRLRYFSKPSSLSATACALCTPQNPKV